MQGQHMVKGQGLNPLDRGPPLIDVLTLKNQKEN
jgi:hypothetical protein